MAKALHCKTCSLVILLFGVHMCHAKTDSVFVKNLFDKYGQGDHMTFEGFEHLLESIGLGHIKIHDHAVTAHKTNGSFTELHPNHAHNVSESHARSDHDHSDHDHSDHSHSDHDHSDHSHSDHDHSDHDHSDHDHSDHEHENEQKNSDHDHGHEGHDHSNHRKREEAAKCEGQDCLKKCLSPQSILFSAQVKLQKTISVSDFMGICPVIVSQLDSKACRDGQYVTKEYKNIKNPPAESSTVSLTVWGCSFAAVAVISLIGLLSVAIIPVIQKKFYNELLQFLVALAVGTLTGDALLHLLPHAFSTEAAHGDNHDHGHSTEGVWRGAMALGGFYVFFVVERVVSIIASKRHDLREKRKLRKKLRETSNNVDEATKMVGDCGSCSDLTMVVHTNKGVKKMAADAHEDWHLMNNIPCNQGLMPTSPSTINMPNSSDPKYCKPDEECDGEIVECHSKRCSVDVTPSTEVSGVAICDETCEKHTIEDVQDSSLFLHTGDHHQSDAHHHHHHNHNHKQRRHSGDASDDHGDEDDHLEENGHGHGHGHSHSHGHSHGVPKSVSAVAWMVIMGDGLHNFCDGMAIGAAFSTGLGGGLSTTVAVLCHELPHELGDFAMLLQAGMSVKKALIYNMVSSVLCVIGMVLGVLVGNIADASLWLFAMTGGMFIYVALIDMLPELTAAFNGAKKPYKQLVVQNVGLLFGMAIMLLIALYEDQIVVDF